MAAKKNIPPVLEIIRDNILKYKNPLAFGPRQNSPWLKDLKIPEKGEVLFYTGGEYQLLPYIDSLVKALTVLDPTSSYFSVLMKGRKIISRTGIAPEKIFAQITAKEKERYHAINYKAAYVLQKLGFNLCYDPRADLYSGALLYELGFWQELKAYAAEVSKAIAAVGAKTIVCLSPHAAEMFKYIYQQITDFPPIEVKTFGQLVWEKRDKLPLINTDGPVVIHDSCRLARDLGISQELRDILDAVGVSYLEPIRNRGWTTCCGGPGKMLFPEISQTIAGRRVKELAETGAHQALVSCPYCLAALEGGRGKRADLMIDDFVEFLYRGIKRNG